MDPPADALASNEPEPTAAAAAVQPETAIVPVPTVALNGASTSVPEPTAAATQPWTSIIPAPDGTTLTFNDVAPNSFLQNVQGNVTVVMGNFTDASTKNNYAGATVNNVESHTMNTGGSAPNGTGGSPKVSAAQVQAGFSEIRSKMDDLKDTVIGQGDRILTAIARKKPRTDYGSPQPM